MTGPLDIGARLFMFRHWVGGYWQPNGTINVDVWRRVIPAVLSSLVSCWVVAPFEIAQKAFQADLKYPPELRKNYRSSVNALLRLPFEEGPAFLFKNSIPTMAGTFVESLVLFFATDYFFDWSRFAHFESGIPFAPMKAASISMAVLLSALASYPFKVTARNVIEFFPGVGEKYSFQYRKGLLDVIVSARYSMNYHGLARYLWTRGPRLFVLLWVAEWLGMFRSWRTSFLSFPGMNISKELQK